MGYMRHHAIVVTSWNEERINAARAEAERIGCRVSPLVKGAINEYHSFLIAPDGSKEEWPTSDEGDQRRRAFIEWVRAEQYIDGGTYVDWAEVQFGDDDREACLVNASDLDLLWREEQ